MSAEQSFEPVAFIGAGVMGLPMIRNLATTISKRSMTAAGTY